MSLFDSIALYTGYATLAAIVLCALYVLGELVWSLIVTCSYLRWQIYTAHLNGGALNTITWSKLPKAIWDAFVEFIGFRAGDISYRHNCGYWKGVGDWNAWASPDGEDSQ